MAKTAVSEPRYHATALHVAGTSAAIAFTVRREASGPNGEATQAFVIVTHDRGATWTPAPLVRTLWSSVRHSGFPVWPPESIDVVELDGMALRIRFRDEWVAFEPGGESLWTGVRRSGGLWTVERVRLLDYDHADESGPAPPLEPSLPPDFAAPPRSALDALASRIARPAPARAIDRYGWLLAIPCAVPFAVWGLDWRAIAATVALLAALPIASLLVARRRCRRACAG